MMLVLVIVLILLALGGGGLGYSRYGVVGGITPIGLILVVLLVLYLAGYLHG